MIGIDLFPGVPVGRLHTMAPIQSAALDLVLINQEAQLCDIQQLWPEYNGLETYLQCPMICIMQSTFFDSVLEVFVFIQNITKAAEEIAAGSVADAEQTARDARLQVCKISFLQGVFYNVRKISDSI